MRLSQRMTAGALTLVIGLGMFALPMNARASEEGRRNTALALGAAAAGLLLTQRNKLPGVVAAAGAAYAYSRYQDRVNQRHRWNRDYDYYDRNDRDYDRYNRNDRYDRYDRDDRRDPDDRQYYDRYDTYNRNDRYDRDDCDRRGYRR